MIDIEDQFSENENGLIETQRQRIQDLKEALVKGVGDDELDQRLHDMLKELFFGYSPRG
jgi:hypothetical protein